MRFDFRYVINSVLSILSVAFAEQIAVIVADPQFGGSTQQIAPVFGVAFGIVWLGGAALSASGLYRRFAACSTCGTESVNDVKCAVCRGNCFSL